MENRSLTYWFHVMIESSGVSAPITATNKDAFVCVISGTIGGLLIGLTTEYYTSKVYSPVRELANSCRTGAATNIIYGLSLGYLSVIAPTLILSLIIYVSFELCDMYGVSLAAVGNALYTTN